MLISGLSKNKLHCLQYKKTNHILWILLVNFLEERDTLAGFERGATNVEMCLLRNALHCKVNEK